MCIRPTFFLDRLIRVQREQRLSVDELEHRQWQRFEKMLHHAAAHSPFYKRKFRLAGLQPEDIRGRDDLATIPFTTREELRSSEQFVSELVDSKSLRESYSSGSTGQSVRSFFGDEAWLIGKYLLKMRARIACGVRPWDRVALIKASQFHNSGFARLVLRQQSFSLHESPERTLAALRRYSPTVIYGFPGHFSHLADIPAPGLRLKSIFTSGEMLSGKVRKKIEAAFGAPVYDVYGCTELKEVAWECPERCGYHINSDWLLVESLPSTVPDEPDHMLAITSLYNFDMPLIRYRLGDTGRMLGGQCRCGRSLPLMAPGFGRSMDYFYLSDGRLISPYTLSGVVELVTGVSQFQLRQLARDTVQVLVVPAADAYSGLAERMTAALQPLLPGTELRIKCVDAIPREPSGKYRKAISLVAKETS